MATCGSLRPLFENPLPENPTLIESLSSWNHRKPVKPVEISSLAEIFGELYFQEKPNPPLAPPLPNQVTQPKNVQASESLSLDSILGLPKNRSRFESKCNGGFSTKNPESLQMCTEGLGSESSDDVDDLMESGDDWRDCGKTKAEIGRGQLMYRGGNGFSTRCSLAKSSKNKREFPPPISSIGKSGKPRVCLKSYREDGRFVLREIRIPTQELLRASREDGRLKLHFVHLDKDIEEDKEEEKDQERDQEIAEDKEEEKDQERDQEIADETEEDDDEKNK